MEIIELAIPGVYEIRLAPVADDRGYFMRTYEKTLFEEAGLHRDWVQENQSRNGRKGIIRGLHFQFPPAAETKLVRCARGEVFDVFVDLRQGSPAFGRWGGLSLSEKAGNMVFIPKGFAHGYCTVTDESDVLYKVDHPYDRAREGGLRWNDPDIGIDWPLATSPVLSTKDSAAMAWKEFIRIHGCLSP